MEGLLGIAATGAGPEGFGLTVASGTSTVGGDDFFALPPLLLNGLLGREPVEWRGGA